MKSMNKHKLLLASLVVSSLLVGCSDSDDNTNNASVFDSYPSEGVFLPYNVLRDDLIDGKSQQPFEIRNGGFGSAMAAHPFDLRAGAGLCSRKCPADTPLSPRRDLSFSDEIEDW